MQCYPKTQEILQDFIINMINLFIIIMTSLRKRLSFMLRVCTDGTA